MYVLSLFSPHFLLLSSTSSYPRRSRDRKTDESQIDSARPINKALEPHDRRLRQDLHRSHRLNLLPLLLRRIDITHLWIRRRNGESLGRPRCAFCCWSDGDRCARWEEKTGEREEGERKCWGWEYFVRLSLVLSIHHAIPLVAVLHFCRPLDLLY